MTDQPPDATPAALYRLISDNRRDCDSGHRRLREDYRSLDNRQNAMEQQQFSLIGRLQHLEEQSKQPTEVSELRFTPSMVFAICSAVVSIIGGNYMIVQSFRTQFEAYTKVQDEKMGALKALTESQDRRIQLLQYDFQAFKDSLSRKGSTR